MLNRLRQIGFSCALKKLKHSVFLDKDTKLLTDQLSKYIQEASLFCFRFMNEDDAAAVAVWDRYQ